MLFVLFVLIIAYVSGVVPSLRPSQAEATSLSWASTTRYPTNIEDQSCAISAGYIYCVGGTTTGSDVTNTAYYSPISTNGVGTWTTTSAYPTSIWYESCVTSSGYIYCVGGGTSGGFANTAYYAPVSSSGIGTWVRTSTYPVNNVHKESCVTYSGYIYCVGGNVGGGGTKAVYYAPLSGSGIGTWIQTSNYPTTVWEHSCAASTGYIYCIGGITSGSTGWVPSVYYATISSNGVGTWASTTPYPTSIYFQSCGISAGYIYCAAGAAGSIQTSAVYYAQVSSNGAGTWTSTSAYPLAVGELSCTLPSNYLYCVGGGGPSGITNAVYSVQIGAGQAAISLTTSSTTNTPPVCPSPPALVTSKLIYANINTTFGSIGAELFSIAAPETVSNFLNLSNSGFYNNLVWHRIVPGFVIQTGDPLTRSGGGNRSLWGTGGSSKTVPLEIYPSLHNYVCYLGMARSSDPNSGSSQFYINLANNTALDGSYTVFGRVISGMDVVDKIAGVQVNANSQPVNPVFMTSVTTSLSTATSVSLPTTLPSAGGGSASSILSGGEIALVIVFAAGILSLLVLVRRERARNSPSAVVGPARPSSKSGFDTGEVVFHGRTVRRITRKRLESGKWQYDLE